MSLRIGGNTGPKTKYYEYDNKTGNILLTDSFEQKALLDPWWGLSCTGCTGDITIVGRTQIMLKLFNLVAKLADSREPVLIEGESGAGKDLIAKTIGAKEKVFIIINCAGIPEALLESELFGHVKGAFTGAVADRKGLFRTADGGALFLNEIANMPLYMQARLLRFTEDYVFSPVGSDAEVSVDVRVISAINKNPAMLVKQGSFRGDLYFRLKVGRLVLLPLRDRKEDIPLLLVYFLLKHRPNRRRLVTKIPSETLEKLRAYAWPGNIRELENEVRRILMTGEGPVLWPEEFVLEEVSELIPDVIGCQTGKSCPGSHHRIAEMERKQRILRLLGKSPGLTAEQLAEIECRSQHTIQITLKNLIKDKRVKCKRDTEDGRIFRYYLA